MRGPRHVIKRPTLGAHAHAHGFWVGMGAKLFFMGGMDEILLVMLQFLNA